MFVKRCATVYSRCKHTPSHTTSCWWGGGGAVLVCTLYSARMICVFSDPGFLALKAASVKSREDDADVSVPPVDEDQYEVTPGFN